jgi:hypothetical protein
MVNSFADTTFAGNEWKRRSTGCHKDSDNAMVVKGDVICEHPAWKAQFLPHLENTIVCGVFLSLFAMTQRNNPPLIAVSICNDRALKPTTAMLFPPSLLSNQSQPVSGSIAGGIAASILFALLISAIAVIVRRRSSARLCAEGCRLFEDAPTTNLFM